MYLEVRLELYFHFRKNKKLNIPSFLHFIFPDPLVPFARGGICCPPCPTLWRVWTPKAVLQRYQHICVRWGLRPPIQTRSHPRNPCSKNCCPWSILLRKSYYNMHRNFIIQLPHPLHIYLWRCRSTFPSWKRTFSSHLSGNNYLKQWISKCSIAI